MDDQISAEYAKEYQGMVINGWIILKPIDHGKSAIVFTARNNEKTAALKIFDKKLVAEFGQDEQLERVNREKSLQDKHHPNLIQIIDGGYDKTTDSIYVIMEYLPWQSLANCIEKIPRDKIKTIIKQLVEAAKFLERYGYAHRDIKPQNIVIDENYENIKLLDLGVMRPIGNSDISEDEDGNAQFLGTQRYASPEFLKGEVEDSPQGWQAVTFYQIGGVLYDLIERKPLFNEYKPYGKTIHAIYSIAPKFEADDIDPKLRHLAINCLQKDAYDRLKLVSWASFEMENIEQEKFVEARERIKERMMRRASRAVTDKKSEVNTIYELTEKYLSLLRQVIINREAFPPMESSLDIEDKNTSKT